MRYYLGIDPGKSGACVILSEDLKQVIHLAYNKVTPHDIAAQIILYREVIVKAYFEGVNAMPGQGVSSTFKFGENYGFWRGLLTGLEIPFERVYPLKWQTAMSCRTGGNKNISKARAQELFPKIKVTHAIADALLIAEYCRRQHIQIKTL